MKLKIIENIQQFYTEHGRIPRYKDFIDSKGKYPNPFKIVKEFGSWNRAIQQAGFLNTQKAWTKEEIIQAVKNFYSQEGRLPRNRDFIASNGKYPSPPKVVREFGSWNQAIKEAGFIPTQIHKIWTKEEIIKVIQDFYKENNTIPQMRDFIDSNGKYPGKTTVQKYFGSWNRAIEEAGFISNKFFGISTYGKDGYCYRSKAEAYFADNFLFKQYKYDIEPKYPKPYNKWYDWYIYEIDTYIELDGGIRPHAIEEKIKINKKLGRQLLVIPINSVYQGKTLNDFNASQSRPCVSNSLKIKDLYRG